MEIVSSVEIIATVLAGLTSLLAGFSSFYASKSKSKEKLKIEIAKLKPSPEKDSRLLEAKDELKRQESITKWQGNAATSLIFSQYIIGGVLATSFIQETLDSSIVGFLGLLVLVSSLIHQHFRPDLIARAAKERVLILRNMIRQVEDDLYAIKEGKLAKDFIHELRAKVTECLKEIEDFELQDSGLAENKGNP